MREPSRKIIDKQIRRYGLGELDDVPCLVKYCKKLIKSWEQQGYKRMPGPAYWFNRRDWIARARENARDVYFVVKKKPGRKYNNDRRRGNDRKGRKAIRRAKHEKRREEIAAAPYAENRKRHQQEMQRCLDGIAKVFRLVVAACALPADVLKAESSKSADAIRRILGVWPFEKEA